MAKPAKNKAFYNSSIPGDWTTPKFGELFSFLKSFSFSRDQLTNKKTSDGIQNIHYGDIHSTFVNEILDFEVEKSVPFLIDGFISKENFDKIDFPVLKDGDLIIADASEDYEGICACIELKNLNKRNVISGLHTFAVRATKEKIALGFRTYILKNEQVVRELRRIATGISVYGVSKTNISNVRLPLPPLPEQKIIAHILDLMDKAMNKNNLLIEKKELQKKWLTQNLLTGKKRLLNNKSDAKNYNWVTVKLGDVFEFVKTYSISREGLSKAKNDDLIYCIHYGDIHALYENDFLDFSTQQSIPQIIDDTHIINERDYLTDGDIIMADASEDYEGVGEVVEVVNIENKIAVGGLHTIVLRGNNEIIANRFSGYLFSGEGVRNRLRKLATGSSVYSVTKTTLQNLSLVIPGSLKEQTAIANVLQTADKEIQLLKAKRDKLKEKKKGLMQILLTGKKRLKVEN